MSDIDDTIRTLTDQVEGLQADMEQLREANEEWSELANEHSLDDLQNFLSEHDLDDVVNLLKQHDLREINEAMEFVNEHDIDELSNALRYNDIDDLVRAYSSIDEYGDPREMAEKVEELEERLAEVPPTLPAVSTTLQNELANDLTLANEKLAIHERALNEYRTEVDRLRDENTKLNSNATHAYQIVNLFNELHALTKTLNQPLTVLNADADAYLENS